MIGEKSFLPLRKENLVQEIYQSGSQTLQSINHKKKTKGKIRNIIIFCNKLLYFIENLLKRNKIVKYKSLFIFF